MDNSSTGWIPRISISIRYFLGSIDFLGKFTVKLPKKPQALSGYHDFSELFCLFEAVHLSLMCSEEFFTQQLMEYG